jgi:outer membrane biosynthesis protein TonB
VKNNKPNISLIRKYLNGELDASAMYQLERQAQDDPMLMDVIIGMESEDPNGDEVHLNEINQRIKDHVQKKQVKKIIPWKSWTVAASLLLAVCFITFRLIQGQEEVRVAGQQKISHKQEKVQIAGDQSISVKNKIKEVNPNILVDSTQPEYAFKTGKSSKQNLIVKREKEIKAVKTLPIQSVRPMPVDSVSIASLARTDSVLYQGNSLNEVAVISQAPQQKNLSTRAISLMRSSQDTNMAVLSGKAAGVKIRGSRSITSNQALNEVVVVGYGAVPSDKVQPIIGWKAYDQYLKEEATLHDQKDGKVTLTFTLASDGTPENFKILKTDNDAIGQKAIQLITLGSKWIAGEDLKSREIKLKIRFH